MYLISFMSTNTMHWFSPTKATIYSFYVFHHSPPFSPMLAINFNFSNHISVLIMCTIEHKCMIGDPPTFHPGNFMM